MNLIGRSFSFMKLGFYQEGPIFLFAQDSSSLSLVLLLMPHPFAPKYVPIWIKFHSHLELISEYIRRRNTFYIVVENTSVLDSVLVI